MNRRSFLGVAAVAGAGALGGCLGGDEPEEDVDATSEDVERFVDEEAGTVCYTFKKGYGGGMSCVPIEDTELSDDNE